MPHKPNAMQCNAICQPGGQANVSHNANCQKGVGLAVSMGLPTTKGKRKTNEIVQTIHPGARLPRKDIWARGI